MTDCDLCGRAIPTVIRSGIFLPSAKIAYFEGAWKGLCKKCLYSAEKTYLSAGQPQNLCRGGKCSLCRKKVEFSCLIENPELLKECVK